jgi:glyoxylase-like metal-dependent hydrolase (beta-lactamase superfamily II)
MTDPLRTPAEWWFPDSTDEGRSHPAPSSLARTEIAVTGDRALILPIQSYLVQTGRHTILVDSCVGNNKLCEYFPHWHDRNDSTFLEQLTRAGVAPEQVDFVLCTHLHVDHCGWNTRLVNGRWVPTFPNARYIMAHRELEAAEAGRSGPGDRTYDYNVLPVVEAGRVVVVDMDYAVDDEVSLEPTPGRTAGHVAIRIRSCGQEAVFCGEPHALANAVHLSRLELPV